MTVEEKALVDLMSEQTSAADGDLLFIESSGTPSKITKANLFGNLAYAFALEEITVTSGTAIVNPATIPTQYKGIIVSVSRFEPVTTGASLGMLVGVNGSGNAMVETSTYSNTATNNTNGTVSGSQTTTTAFGLTPPILSSFGPTGRTEYVFTGFNEVGGYPDGLGSHGGVVAGSLASLSTRRLTQRTPGNYNAIQFFCDSGNFEEAKIKIYGIL